MAIVSAIAQPFWASDTSTPWMPSIVTGHGDPRGAVLSHQRHGLVDEAAERGVGREVDLAGSPAGAQEAFRSVQRLLDFGLLADRLDATVAELGELAHLPAHDLARLGTQVLLPALR